MTKIMMRVQIHIEIDPEDKEVTRQVVVLQIGSQLTARVTMTKTDLVKMI